MRVVSAGRLIAISIVLIALGMSPMIVDVLDEHLLGAAAWPLQRLSLQPLFDQLAHIWVIVAAKLHLATTAGAVLFAIGAGWAVAARFYKGPWAKDTALANPTRMNQVLLREAELIEGRQPNPEEWRRIDDFQQQSEMRARESQDETPLNEVSPHLYRWLYSPQSFGALSLRWGHSQRFICSRCPAGAGNPSP
jgi:hypothetical protein